MQGVAIHVLDILADAEFVKLFTQFRRTPRITAFLFPPYLGEVKEELGWWVSRLVGSEDHEVRAERGAWSTAGHRYSGSSFVAENLGNAGLHRAPELVLPCNDAVEEFREELPTAFGGQEE